MRPSRVLAAFLLFALPSSAGAQSTDDDEEVPTVTTKAKPPKGKKGKGKRKPPEKAEPEPTPAAAPEAPAEDAIPTYDDNGDPAGAAENPGAPTTPWDRPATPAAAPTPEAAAPPVRYPLERILRPLVLPRRMFEIGLAAPMGVDPGRIGGVVRLTFGVTRELELGLRYGAFLASSDRTIGGKAVALEATYAIFPWLGARVALPVLFDPYAQGLTLGAPLRFVIADRLRLDALGDLVGIKLYRFLPSAVDPGANEGLTAVDEINGVVPDGELNVGFLATYQASPAASVDLRYNVRMPDFKSDGAPHELTVGGAYALSWRFDLAARLGFLDLASADDSFVAEVAAAFRI